MRQNKKKKSSFVKKTAKALLIALSVFACVTLVGILSAIIYINTPIAIDKQLLINKSQAPLVYDNEDKLTQYSVESINYADYEQLPQHLKDAFVALEDKRFYKHNGVDYIRILGATIANIKKGRLAQGGSTITQQIVKNVFLTSEKSFERKLKEARYAISIEREFTKDQIIEIYLNMPYFGSGEYGVKNACKRFFDCDVKDITVAQSALLAGIVKSPTKYNPINNYDNAIQRSRIVLELMLEQGKIDKDSYNNAINETIIIKNTLKENSFDRSYVSNALEEACSLLNISEKDFKASGYKLYTYLNTEKQKLIYNTINNKSFYPDSESKILSTGISVNNQNYTIDAIAANGNINVFSYRRQAGSTLKPLVAYTPAFECGIISPSSIINDAPTAFGDYSPKNYNNKYYGNISVRDCIAYSLNIPAVYTLTTLGVQQGYNALIDMGFKLDQSDDNLSLALGSTLNGTTFSELLGGYTTLANYGKYSPITCVRKITDSKDNIVYIHKPESKQIFSEESAYLSTNSLLQCSKTGTAKKLSSFDFQIASKTGTVQCQDGNSDAYTISYTSDSTVLFWQGSQDYNTPMNNNITGGGTPCLMTKNYYENIYNNTIPDEFYVPQNIVVAKIDKNNSTADNIVLASENAPKYSYTEDIFNAKYLPKQTDTSFDYPKANNLSFKQDDIGVVITFDANANLCYKIIKKALFEQDRIITEIKNKQQTVTVNDIPSGIFGYNRYIVIPYYIDDNGKEVLGQIQQFFAD